ncbi:MAG: DEAD/DEAH box helicase [Bacteroidetes bacterium]|nr:DEAD/DEAH box helicase [Bacteroidota bacterium]MBK9671851.1 DEAD/DEAH box helicase [Bacteroidota bacterium]MBP6413841.1 DEAD/DEAH box helicase [Bacteroidia bacterium]
MNRFEELGIDNRIVKAITELGFENPTPIQEATIPALLNNKRDLVGLAQTGTGKTAAFGLPMVQMVDFNSRNTQALIICPTRELCLQITRDLQNFTKYVDGAHIVAIYGGASLEMQSRELSRGAQIVVATPGRMVDMISRRKVKLAGISIVVLDEADEMLNMGFKEDLDSILSETPESKNTWLFSATMQNEVARIAKNYMSNPHEVTVGKQNQGAENIEHRYYIVHAKDKYNALKRIADFNPEIFGIVFCRTRIETQQIAEQLIKDGYNADALHGDLSQQQRDQVMARYRSKTLQMLVATDVAARGIDVNDVTHVINYNLPDDIENYTHRSGRTARAGKSGVSIVIINMKEVGKIRMIERQIGKKFVHDKLPTGKEVCEKQLFYLVNKIHDVEVNDAAIDSFLPKINEMLNDLSKDELIKRMVSAEFNRFIEYYKKSADLNVDVKSADRRENRGQDGAPTGRFFVNIGEMDGLNVMSLRDYICEVTTLDKGKIGRIDVKEKFSFFDIEPRLSEMVMDAFKSQRFKGRSVHLEISSGVGSGGNRSRGGEGGGFSKGSGGGGYRGGRDSGGYRGGNRSDKSFGNKRSYSDSGKSSEGRSFSSPKKRKF